MTAQVKNSQEYTPISEEMKWVGPNPDKATYFAIETVIYYLGNISYLVIILLLPISSACSLLPSHLAEQWQLQKLDWGLTCNGKLIKIYHLNLLHTLKPTSATSIEAITTTQFSVVPEILVSQ